MQGGCLSSGLHSSFHVWAVRKRSVQHLEEHSEVRGSQGDGGQEGSAESQHSCWAWVLHPILFMALKPNCRVHSVYATLLLKFCVLEVSRPR